MSLLWDFIAPQLCISCHQFGNFICENCIDTLSFYSESIPLQLEKNYLDELFATVHYVPPATELVKKLKYKSSWALTETIAEIMHLFIPIEQRPDLLTFVPLHTKRQWERGFNQAEHLTKYLSQYWKINNIQLVYRVQATTPQAELLREQRLTHLNNAFIYQSNLDINGKTIGIVDDVSTTGTTLNECAKILKEHGAKKVIGIVFAHGK